VLQEIDTPGHTESIAHSHPEHIACDSSSPWSQFAAEPPSGQLRVASANTTDFTASVLSAVAKTLPSKLFSTGGDEVNINCYMQDARTLADLQGSGKNLEQALDAFVQAAQGVLLDQGKTPVVWEGKTAITVLQL
jgi:hexosaminidase